MSSAEILRITHAMSLDVGEFLRLLPVALVDRRHEHRGNCISVLNDQRRVEITYAALPDLQVASLRLPRVQVDFNFTDFPPEDCAAFVESFLRHYQRGGG